MVEISYTSMAIAISTIWIVLRVYCWFREKQVNWKRELQLLLVYICIVVVARITFFPFERVNGRLQPLVFDSANWFPFRINVVPIVHMLDYPKVSEAVLNFVGNTTMFIPIGVIFPIVYKQLNTHGKVIAAGIGFSLFVELLQLPFHDRVTDIDDLLMNSIGFLTGYGLYLGFRKLKNVCKRRTAHRR